MVEEEKPAETGEEPAPTEAQPEEVEGEGGAGEEAEPEESKLSNTISKSKEV